MYDRAFHLYVFAQSKKIELFFLLKIILKYLHVQKNVLIKVSKREGRAWLNLHLKLNRTHHLKWLIIPWWLISTITNIVDIIKPRARTMKAPCRCSVVRVDCVDRSSTGCFIGIRSWTHFIMMPDSTSRTVPSVILWLQGVCFAV